jgi:hypothetical protein
MFNPTKTEAAETVAVEVRVFARRAGRTEVTKTLVEERISELRGYWANGTQNYLTECATVANVRTTLRKALEVPL